MWKPQSRWIIALVSVALVAWGVAPAYGQRLARPVPQGGQQWEVVTGVESADKAVQVLKFYPATITVNVGDTITWTNPTPEIHTVTFLAPGQPRPRFDPNDPQQAAPQGDGRLDGSHYLNSGILQAGQQQSWTVTAAQPGTYQYICLVHEKQLGTVVVNPAGTPYPRTAAEYAAERAEAEPLIAMWQQRLAAYQPTVRERADGTREYVINGGMGDGIVAVMRFQPQTVDIQVGDTVIWDNLDSETPHTVTFGPLQGPPEQVWGDPRAFDGTTPLNSGYFGPAWPAGATYAVTFTAPGQWPCVCILHAPMLMLGTVNVAPRS
jgi:plastocyanin